VTLRRKNNSSGLGMSVADGGELGFGGSWDLGDELRKSNLL